MSTAHKRIILLAPSEDVATLSRRLRMQDYTVEEAKNGVEAASLALGEPPAAVIADLWMSGVSGVQLCRLLKGEAATAHVPIILRGPGGQRNRFWAEQAGAADYVVTGRMGDLVRALGRAIEATPPADEFFMALGSSESAIRDRIAARLDAALFESVLAAEVRALGACGSFERLFDLLSQFVSRVTSYRWLAVTTRLPGRMGLHVAPSHRSEAEAEARQALRIDAEAPVNVVEDGDAFADSSGPPPIVRPIVLAGIEVGTIALAVRFPQGAHDAEFVDVIAREVAGPLRMASLVEESQRLATIDALTGLMNRRALLEAMGLELARAERHGYSCCIMMLDVDHFKQINDTHGHASGDAVLSATGRLLRTLARKTDLVARWGGEEFLVVLHGTRASSAVVVAERYRAALAALEVSTGEDKVVRMTGSFGVAEFVVGESVDVFIDRADRAMYEAKAAGRDRVVRDPRGSLEPTQRPQEGDESADGEDWLTVQGSAAPAPPTN